MEKLPESAAAQVRAALGQIPAAFGRPHVHAGIGLRQLKPGVYEARIGLGLRAVFSREDDILVVECIGHHDDVRRFLRSF